MQPAPLHIGEVGGQPPRGGAQPSVASAPEFLRGILSINVETLDRSDNKYWCNNDRVKWYSHW